MLNGIYSLLLIQNKLPILNTTHDQGSRSHTKEIDKMQSDMQALMQACFIEGNKNAQDKKETKVKAKTPLQSERGKIDVNSDDDSKQKKQRKKNFSQQNNKNEKETKPFDLDSLEMISQINKVSIKTTTDEQKAMLYEKSKQHSLSTMSSKHYLEIIRQEHQNK